MREYLTVAEVADLRRVSASTIYEQIRRGELRAEKFGGRKWLIPRDALRERVPGVTR